MSKLTIMDLGLLYATQAGNLERVNLLLMGGADVNCVNNHGVTPLISAAYGGYTDIADALLLAGAYIDTQEENDYTALMMAVYAGHIEVVKLLVQHGANLNIQDEEGDTALCMAVLNGSIDIVTLLLQQGADKNILNDQKESALIIAIRNGHMAIAETLASLINATDTHTIAEQTSLTLAVEKNQTNLIRVLLRAGIRPDLATVGVEIVQQLLDVAIMEPDQVALIEELTQAIETLKQIKITTHQIKVTAEMNQIDTDLKAEGNSDTYLSGSASSIALMMAIKKQNRQEKNKPFMGFVLEQNSKKDNEFTRFLDDLRASVSQIPPNTRIQLAVQTNYIDDIKDKYFYDRGIRVSAHWTAIDILVGENGVVSSFVLDAARGQGHKGIHADLKQCFPTGKHYIFEATRFSTPIQTRGIGCRVFVVEHLKQLSQINSSTLYEDELPTIAGGGSSIISSAFVSGQKLIRIFRGIESWSVFGTLAPEIIDSVIKNDSTTNMTVTLFESAQKNNIVVNGKWVNNTIKNKSDRYKDKKREFVATLSLSDRSQIIENRQGFIFLHNPALFKLDRQLLGIHTTGDLAVLIHALTTTLRTRLPSVNNDRAITDTINELSSIDFSKQSLGAIKNRVLLSITVLFNKLEKNHDSTLRDTVSTIIFADYLTVEQLIHGLDVRDTDARDQYIMQLKNYLPLLQFNTTQAIKILSKLTLYAQAEFLVSIDQRLTTTIPDKKALLAVLTAQDLKKPTIGLIIDTVVDHWDYYRKICISPNETTSYFTYVEENPRVFFKAYQAIHAYIHDQTSQPNKNKINYFKQVIGRDFYSKVNATAWLEGVLTGNIPYNDNTYKQHRLALNNGTLGRIFNMPETKTLITQLRVVPTAQVSTTIKDRLIAEKAPPTSTDNKENLP